AGVDLAVHRGESVAIMGAAGSGKTTSLHVLAGITAPDSGRVVFQPSTGTVIDVTALGEAARSRLRRERFGFVFQQGLLIPELTAVENDALASMINGVAKK
ncbi:ATP-binding cassette domain-containing protein, partial [Microbacterium sp. GbtcB4]|uniref:ATP-binding cassette domain-containing protein n=1 Tax=Microbacterium sp. GbtcB4 TaxID=2824749 RepID=UPI001C2F1A99